MKRLSEYTDAEFGRALDAEMDRRLDQYLQQEEERQVVADFTEGDDDDER